jgi:uncharacterized membrane protein YdjX (TVP38/TMEM64 family)
MVKIEREAPTPIMAIDPDSAACRKPDTAQLFSLRRWWPLAAIVVLAVIVYAMGWHHQLSLETLVRHRAAIQAFVAAHEASALALFVALYIAAVALSVPGAVWLTISGGFLFGVWVGTLASMVGAVIGATLVFLIAKSACGEHLVRRAGPLAARLADEFRADAFSYLLVLRLVPAFPFFLVNLVPAVLGVRLSTFVTATALGIIPATFAFASIGAGLNSVISAQEAAYHACLAAGRADCRLDFDLMVALTPQVLAALVALAVLALLPVAIKRWRGRAPIARRSG